MYIFASFSHLVTFLLCSSDIHHPACLSVLGLNITPQENSLRWQRNKHEPRALHSFFVLLFIFISSHVSSPSLFFPLFLLPLLKHPQTHYNNNNNDNNKNNNPLHPTRATFVSIRSSLPSLLLLLASFNPSFLTLLSQQPPSFSFHLLYPFTFSSSPSSLSILLIFPIFQQPYCHCPLPTLPLPPSHQSFFSQEQ